MKNEKDSKDIIKERYDFMLFFDVADGNPNGDPDAGNLPRIDPETNHGLTTDVMLKRKVRDFVTMVKAAEEGYGIYVAQKAILGNSHFKAYEKLGIDTGEESRKKVYDDLQAEIRDQELPEGLTLIDDGESDVTIVVAPTTDKKIVLEWMKDAGLSKKLTGFLNKVMKDAKPRKANQNEVEKGRQQMCKDFYDIRTFGALMTITSAPNCGQVRGPVQMTFGRSIDPITWMEHAITRVAVTSETEAAKQNGENRMMGRKTTIPYGLYVSHGFISPYLANQTGFTYEDLDLLWDALESMFEHDRSAARGMMSTCRLIIFKHTSPLGDAPANRLFERVEIKNVNEDKPARKFKDYQILLDGKPLDNNDTIHVIDVKKKA